MVFRMVFRMAEEEVVAKPVCIRGPFDHTTAIIVLVEKRSWNRQNFPWE